MIWAATMGLPLSLEGVDAVLGLEKQKLSEGKNLICGCFTSSSRQASCNYGIGKDGRISLCVEEKNRSWCSSSNANDQRAVTIECASDMSEPYAMNSAVYNSLVNLCVDICKRNGKKKLLWFADKNKTLNYAPKSNEMVLTVHRWFANKGAALLQKCFTVDFLTKRGRSMRARCRSIMWNTAMSRL